MAIYNNPRLRSALSLITFFILMLASTTPVSAATHANSDKHTYSIVLVNSFNESDFEARLMYRLMHNVADDESLMVLTVPAYYADSVSKLGDDIKQTILDNFRYQISSLIQSGTDITIDRIVAIGRHASVFLDTNPSLYPEASRFFLHIDWQPERGILIPSDYDPTSSFRQIMTALPDTREIIFIHGSKDLPLDKDLVANFLEHTPRGVDVHYYNPMRQPQQTLHALKGAADGTPIIYINYKYFERNWETVHKWLTSQQRMPVFTIFAHNVDRYAGGAVVVPEKLADTAVALARGEDVSTSENSVISLQFNAQQLSSWGINKSNLPADAEIVNQRPSVFSIETVLMIISLFMGIIVVMAFWMLYKTRSHAVKMEHALVQADGANKSKSEFLANMSHEIRTPMNGVLGTLQIIERNVTDPQTRKNVSNALFSANSLLTIINDILDYSKIEANKLSLENEPFSLLEVIESVVSDLGVIASSKGVLLTTNIAPGFKDGWIGDLVRVRQIVLNITSNAVKFTDNGSVIIHVSTLPSQAGVCIQIVDTGVGMSAEVLATIFDRFTQADSSTTRKFGGTGLGMSITQSLISLMKGSINVSSTEKRGTDITVHLPLEKASAEIFHPEPEQASIPLLSGKQILIAEDNQINQAVIESMLEDTQASLIMAANGKIAVDIFTANHIDLVLMDIQMPVMDGIEAFRRMQALKPTVPVIALTADVMTNEIANYLELGFVEHIGKPIDMNRLFRALHRYT